MGAEAAIIDKIYINTATKGVHTRSLSPNFEYCVNAYIKDNYLSVAFDTTWALVTIEIVHNDVVCEQIFIFFDISAYETGNYTYKISNNLGVNLYANFSI